MKSKRRLLNHSLKNHTKTLKHIQEEKKKEIRFKKLAFVL